MSEKKYYFPENVYNETFFSEWEKEYEIPEDFPDISRLIRADSNPKINSVVINSANSSAVSDAPKIVEIEGDNTFNILFHSTEDEKIHNIVFTDFFNINEDIKQNSDNLIATAKIFCVFMSCKVISKRKVYIKAKNKITLNVINNKSLNVPNIDSQNTTLHFNVNSFNTQTFLPPSTISYNLEEALTVDGTYPPIERIVFTSVRIIPLDLVKSSGSATLNTTVIFKVFYESQNRYYLFSRSIPVSLTLEDADIDENTLLYYFLSITNQSATVEMDNYGEERIIKFSYSPQINLFKVKESSEELPIDVFSETEYLETENSLSSFEELIGVIQRPFTVEKIFEIPDTEFNEIYDSSAVIDVEKFEATAEGKNLSGICGISVLGLTEKGIESANFNVNFNQFFPEIKDEYISECFVYPIQTSASISGRNMISFRVSANATIRQYKKKQYNLLSGFTSSGKREEKDKSCITLYYPSYNQSLWDISKEYGISPNIIAKENPHSFSGEGLFISKSKNIFIP